MHKLTKFYKNNWQVITGLIAAVILLSGGLYLQHRDDTTTVSDKPVVDTPGSATYAGDIKEVELRGLYAGSVTVQPSGSNDKADVQNAGTEGGSLRLITTVRNNKLTVRQTGDCVPPGSSNPCTASFNLSIPVNASVSGESKGANLTFARLKGSIAVTNAGPITVNGGSGKLELSSSTGNITLAETISKEVSAKTRNGAIAMQYSGVPDDVSAESDNGNIDIVVPSGMSYKVTADAKDGNERVSAQTTDSDDHEIIARTGKGNVTVTN